MGAALLYILVMVAIAYSYFRGKDTPRTGYTGDDYTEEEIVWFFDEALDDNGDDDW